MNEPKISYFAQELTKQGNNYRYSSSNTSSLIVIALATTSFPLSTGSLNSGRLYNQATAMSRFYAKPMLLIEFDQVSWRPRKLWSCDVRNVFLFVICSHPSYAGFLSQHLLQIHAKRFANVMLIFKSKEGTRKLYFAKWGETNESKISDGAWLLAHPSKYFCLLDNSGQN